MLRTYLSCYAKASQDERTKEGLGMIEENLASLTPEGSYDDAFSHWLQGMFFLRLGQDAADREKARKELLAATQLNGTNEAFRQDLKEAEAPAGEGQGTIVYVIAETGMCPEWYQQRVDIPLFVVSSRVPYVSVALPAIRPSGLNYNLKLKLDSQDVAFPLASRTIFCYHSCVQMCPLRQTQRASSHRTASSSSSLRTATII